MFHDLEGKNRKELIQIIGIQAEETIKIENELMVAQKANTNGVIEINSLRSKVEKQGMQLKESYRHEDNAIQENTELRRKCFRKYNDEEYWIFQDDGEDYPETIMCPVVMSADKLRELIEKGKQNA